MPDPMLVGLCGSLRKASFNRLLMHEAARHWPGSFAEGDLRLPLYDGDVEAEGIPESVAALGALIARADALIFASPEYNKGPSGVLKNALDWLSRLKPNPLWNKPAVIVSAAAGRSGGERGQTMLRAMLHPHRVEALLWPEVLVGGAEAAFDRDGRLIDRTAQELLEKLMTRLRDRVLGAMAQAHVC